MSEYGVHWNFFFTLAAISVLGSILTITVPHRMLPYMGVLLLIGMRPFTKDLHKAGGSSL